jgi:hypothetical protein
MKKEGFGRKSKSGDNNAPLLSKEKKRVASVLTPPPEERCQKQKKGEYKRRTKSKDDTISRCCSLSRAERERKGEREGAAAKSPAFPPVPRATHTKTKQNRRHTPPKNPIPIKSPPHRQNRPTQNQRRAAAGASTDSDVRCKCTSFSTCSPSRTCAGPRRPTRRRPCTCRAARRCWPTRA